MKSTKKNAKTKAETMAKPKKRKTRKKTRIINVKTQKMKKMIFQAILSTSKKKVASLSTGRTR